MGVPSRSTHLPINNTHMAKKTKVKKIRFVERTRRYYGLEILKSGTKFAWISAQNKYGWSLGLALNKRTVWLRNIRFADRKDVEKALGKSSVVFVELKKSAK